MRQQQNKNHHDQSVETNNIPKVKKQNNDIRQLVRPGQVRLVNFDLDSPRMTRAMYQLGFQKKDLETDKRRDDFRSVDSNA